MGLGVPVWQWPDGDCPSGNFPVEVVQVTIFLGGNCLR